MGDWEDYEAEVQRLRTSVDRVKSEQAAKKREEAALLPKAPTSKGTKQRKKYPTLDAGSTSVRTVSGGGFEQNRKRH